MMPMLQRVKQIYESDPQRRPDLQKLLQDVWQVVGDCNEAIRKWSEPSGVSGVRRLNAYMWSSSLACRVHSLLACREHVPVCLSRIKVPDSCSPSACCC